MLPRAQRFPGGPCLPLFLAFPPTLWRQLPPAIKNTQLINHISTAIFCLPWFASTGDTDDTGKKKGKSGLSGGGIAAVVIVVLLIFSVGGWVGYKRMQTDDVGSGSEYLNRPSAIPLTSVNAISSSADAASAAEDGGGPTFQLAQDGSFRHVSTHRANPLVQQSARAGTRRRSQTDSV
jgi:hypothetical protein